MEIKEKVVTPKEVQEVLRITPPTERKWRRLGTLPNVLRIGRKVYYTESDIAAFIEARNNTTT